MLFLALWRVALQEAIQYRAEALIWFLFDALPPIMMAFVWIEAYRGQDSVAGYDLESMLAYTLGVMVLRNIITAHIEWDVAGSIRQGTLSTHLVRPVNVWGLWFLTGLASRVVRGILVTPILLASLVWLAPHLSGPNVELGRVPALLVSLISAYLMSFLIKLCIGILGFWLTDIFGVLSLVEIVAFVFGGMLLPLDLLPPSLRAVAAVLPFQYVYYVPLSALNGRLAGAELAGALAIQVAWVGALLGLAYAGWRLGLRRYEAVGG